MHKDKKIIVVGAGKTGFSCIRYLVAQNLGNNIVAVVDNRSNPPYLSEIKKQYPKLPIYLGNFAVDILAQADEIVLSPGVSLHEPVINECLQRKINIIGDIELFARAAKRIPILGITGSNGKSTVTSLLGEMAKASLIQAKVGGNLGVPALDLLDERAKMYILELSSFQLETVQSLAPLVSVILNVSPDHMDRYKCFNDYLRAKQRIYLGSKIAVINRDDPQSYANISLPPKVISFGTDKPFGNNFGIVDNFLVYGDSRLISIDKLGIKGLHNATNALAALAVGLASGMSMEAMLKTLPGFSGLPHRCQFIAKIDGVDWYNDSKGTNVGATESAIKGLGRGFGGKIVLLAGGLGKSADFAPLRLAVSKYVRTVILLGKDAKLIDQALRGVCKILYASSIADAITLCKQEADSGDIVLFSPACASFDMFKNFEHRGEVFMEEVKKFIP